MVRMPSHTPPISVLKAGPQQEGAAEQLS